MTANTHLADNQSGRKNSFIWEIVNGFASLFFPISCVVCNKSINRSKALVCDKCWDELAPLSDDIIQSKPVPENLDSILPVFEFNDTIQLIIHALKYRGYKSLGIELGKKVAERLPGNYFQPGSVLIPVPLHPVKKRERGYNQAEFIARGISEICGIPVLCNLVKRVKNTETQTHLNAEERHANMLNAFSVPDKAPLIDIQAVILIDDVFTTGATMNSAAHILKVQGIPSIKGLTVAAPIQNH